MRYAIDKSRLADLFSEEVSRVAAMTFSEQGVSLYDHVHNLSQDEGAVARHIEDGIDIVVRRFADVATYDGTSIDLFLPDFEESQGIFAEREITRTIVMGAVAGWLQEKSNARAQEYAERTKIALEKTVGILRQRRKPQRMEYDNEE